MGRLPIFAATVAALIFQFPVSAYADNKNRSGRSWLPDPVTDADYFDNGAPDAAKVQLGAQLFFDKILSGNLNISCATCHHSFTATGDGLSLPIGEGGRGLGVTRDTGVGADAVLERVPRNSPALFNLGAREFTSLFHDGRVQPNAMFPNGVESPAGFDLPEGLDSPLAVQAMFPVTSATEMAGQAGENPVADAVAAGDLSGPFGVWEQLAERLRGIDGYVEQFIRVFDDVDSADDIRFTHAASAIAAFEATNWRADNSPFDRFLRGERAAMSVSAFLGMRIFYSANKGNCVSCHGGVFQTEHSFRAIAVPQLGPGKGDGAFGYEDFGRERVTGNPADRYRFRVPSLRNVAQTAPYGHSGAFDTLEAMLRHHLDPVASLYGYDASQAVMPSRPDLDAKDYRAMSDANVVASIAKANELSPVHLSEREVRQLIDFLHALTDPAMLDMRGDVPKALPSGMPLGEL
uniref:Methylamine utilization protein MauG n=1 Tax=uncultured bacterium ws198A12 TaxID=1131830 RepID=I1X5J9_9BACT|nr:methylamine utilization protein MauG [uncultured bacterium ws198A12]